MRGLRLPTVLKDQVETNGCGSIIHREQKSGLSLEKLVLIFLTWVSGEMRIFLTYWLEKALIIGMEK